MEHSIREVIDRFKEGEKLYNTSPLFNRCVHSIAAGVDVYEILETLININEEQVITMQNIIKSSSMPRMIIIDNADK